MVCTAVSAPNRRVSFSVAMAKSVIYFPRVANSQQNSSMKMPQPLARHTARDRFARHYSLDGSLLRSRSNNRDLRFFRRERRQHCGQLDPKNRAALLRVVAKNLPRVLLYDAKTNAQAKPGTFAHWFRGVKGIEHALWILDAWSGVGEKNHHIATVANGFNG